MKKQEEFKTKRNTSVHCEIVPKPRKCRRCEIYLFDKGQQFIYHEVLAECIYRVETNRFTKEKKSFLRDRKVLEDKIINTEPRLPTPMNIPGHDGMCRMCQLTNHGINETELILKINKELQENYGIVEKEKEDFFEEFIEEEPIDIVLEEEVL